MHSRGKTSSVLRFVHLYSSLKMMKWWIIAVTFCCAYKVLAVPRPASTPSDKAVDKEDQTTPWKNIKEMQRAHDFPYPLDKESMPEVVLNINGHVGHSRLTRQSEDSVSASPSLQSEYLQFANRQFLVSINKDGTNAQALRLTHSSGVAPNAIAIDYDIRNDILFWSDVQYRRIYVANLNGSNLTPVITTNITTPDGLAWDWINHNLYWTDAEDKDIEVYDSHNLHRKVLIQNGPNSKPRAIVLDPANRVMYWTDWGTPATIEKASMDGSSRTVLHNTSLGWPNGLTIDYAAQKLYWVDASLDRIESSSTDGTQRQLLSTRFIYHPFSIQYSQGYLYWTDWYFNAVLKAPVNQTRSVGVVISNLLYDPMTIRAVSLERQPMSVNPCGTNNGGCSHLCLLSSSNSTGFSCACPDGFDLDATKRNCTTPHAAISAVLS